MQDHEFILRPSRWYLGITCLLAVASIGIVVCLTINVVLKLCLLTVVVAYSMHILWHYVLMQSKRAIIAIRRLSEGGWYICTLEQSDSVILQGDSTVTNYVMILRFRSANAFWPRSCVIFPDALKPDLYRRLLVILKTEKISSDV